jgi:hypothetical protein
MAKHSNCCHSVDLRTEKIYRTSDKQPRVYMYVQCYNKTKLSQHYFRFYINEILILHCGYIMLKDFMKAILKHNLLTVLPCNASSILF